MQVWNVLHAARWKYRTQKWCKNRHLRTIAQLCQAISLQRRHISTIGKNSLSSNISPTCPYIMVNFGPLAAEIVSLVWGTPANFNRFRVLAALLHSTLLVGVSQTAVLNSERHLYLAGRPSRWALAHISSFCFSFDFFVLVLCAYVVLGLVSSVVCQEIGWEEHFRNDLFCVEWDVKC